jgi:hypothetical protein
MIKTRFSGGKQNLVMVVDGLLEDGLCSRMLSALIPFYSKVSAPGRTMGGVVPRTKSSLDGSLSRSTFAEQNLDYVADLEIGEQKLVEALGTGIQLYRQEYSGLEDWADIMDSGFQIQKYQKGQGFYRPHVDSFPGTESSNRVAAGIFYLNTVEQGGETYFPLHDISVEPLEGRLVIFPACWTHRHEGRIPVSSDKWIINTFLLNASSGEIHTTHPENHNHDHDHPHDELLDSDFSFNIG